LPQLEDQPEVSSCDVLFEASNGCNKVSEELGTSGLETETAEKSDTVDTTNCMKIMYRVYMAISLHSQHISLLIQHM
jgi:hypothetical protein